MNGGSADHALPPFYPKNLLPVCSPLRRIDDTVCLIHMADRPVPQPTRRGYILGPRQVVLGRRKQLLRLTEAVMRAQTRVDSERVVHALAIVDRSLLDLANRCIDLADGSIVIMLYRSPRPPIIQVVPGSPQVAQTRADTPDAVPAPVAPASSSALPPLSVPPPKPSIVPSSTFVSSPRGCILSRPHLAIPTLPRKVVRNQPSNPKVAEARLLEIKHQQPPLSPKPHAILEPEMYKRVLLKLSGEALAAGSGFGIDAIFIHKVAAEIAAVHALGCEIGIVVGGGNFFRGVAQQAIDMDRVAADHMGMLSTVINAIALQDAIEKQGLICRVMSAIAMHQVAEPYIRRRAMRHLEKGRIVIFAAGTGNPYFSTDTAASLRAMEIKADILLKATSVDGIYTADPKTDPTATKLPDITYADIQRLNLRVMDQTAVSLCKDNNMPMMVFSMREEGNIVRVVSGEKLGSLVTS